MSYLVMECRRSYAVLLDQEGRFVKAANLRYEVGQTVFDPVLLEEPARAPTPGQLAVFYQEDVVVGSAWIEGSDRTWN